MTNYKISVKSIYGLVFCYVFDIIVMDGLPYYLERLGA